MDIEKEVKKSSIFIRIPQLTKEKLEILSRHYHTTVSFIARKFIERGLTDEFTREETDKV